MREETFLWHEAKYNYQRDVLLLRPHTSAGHTERGEEEKKGEFMDGEKEAEISWSEKFRNVHCVKVSGLSGSRSTMT